MAKTKVAVLGLAGLILAAAATPAEACVCYESEGLTADFAEAAAVFAGRVVAIELSEERVGGLAVGDMTATIQVERLWKGPKDKLLRVHTCGTQAQLCTCGTDFKVGARFVVFAVGEPLGTGSCQRTREYTRLEEEPGLEWLGAENLIRDLDALKEPSSNRMNLTSDPASIPETLLEYAENVVGCAHDGKRTALPGPAGGHS